MCKTACGRMGIQVGPKGKWNGKTSDWRNAETAARVGVAWSSLE